MALHTFVAGDVLEAQQLNDSFAAVSGMTLISTTTIGSAVSSVNVTSAFSSTYDNYRITINGGVASTLLSLRLTLGATTTGYYYAGYYTQYSSGVITGGNGSNTTSWYAGLGTTGSLDADIRLFSPNLAKNTMFHATLSQAATGGTGETYGGFVNTTTQYTDFTITTSTGTITGGSIRLYGLKN